MPAASTFDNVPMHVCGRVCMFVWMCVDGTELPPVATDIAVSQPTVMENCSLGWMNGWMGGWMNSTILNSIVAYSTVNESIVVQCINLGC